MSKVQEDAGRASRVRRPIDSNRLNSVPPFPIACDLSVRAL